MAIILSAVTWGGAFIIGAAFALIMIILIWQRFQSTPTITTVETYYHPIWNVPFPAVTICNINKVYRPATKNIKRKLYNLLIFFAFSHFGRGIEIVIPIYFPIRLDYGVNETHIEYFFKKMSGLVRPPPQQPNDVLLNVYDILEKMGYTSETLMREVMQPCNKMLYYCLWLNKEYPCDELFQVSKGSEGFCCSFNYGATKDAVHVDKHFRVSGRKIASLVLLVLMISELF